VLLVGCGTCVKVCFTGGDKEVAVLASQLRLSAAKARRKLAVDELTVERQCEIEFVDEVAKQYAGHDVIMSMACGAGAQMLASRFPRSRCCRRSTHVPRACSSARGSSPRAVSGAARACSGAPADLPVTRCAKSLFNGPCGGSQGGKCEVGGETPCAWHQIIERLTTLGQLDNLTAPVAPKDWRSARHGGPRKLVREDNIL